MRYNTLVAGGGPAGSEAARVIAESGEEVVVLERAESGTISTCGGAVGNWWLRKLGISLPEEVKLSPIKTVTIHSPSETASIQSEELRGEELGWIIDREAFDGWLQDKAKEKGAEFKYGVKAKIPPKHGAGSIVIASGAGTLQNQPRNHKGYQEIVGMDGEYGEIELWFDPKRIGTGYVWKFPMGGGRFRLGVGVPVSDDRSPRSVLEWFKKKRGVNVLEREGGLVGTGSMVRYPSEDVLTVGGAAHLTGSLTGAGIFPAIKSGQIAGKCIVEGRKENYWNELTEELDRWWKIQDLGRELTTNLGAEGWNRVIRALEKYRVKSGNPVNQVPGFLIHAFSTEPGLIPSLLKSFFG